jgi:uncharacterized protein YfaS (alpha-2-macroglobulin family)
VPYNSSVALITTERANVIDYKIVRTSEDNQTFTVDLSDKQSPNAFVSGVFVKHGDQVKDPAEFKQGIVEVRVDNPAKRVDLAIDTAKERYNPGEKLSGSVIAKDGNGNPVKSEISLAVVDESVWSLSRVSLAESYETFYRPRNLQVYTSQSLTKSMDRILEETFLQVSEPGV